jgi:DNA-binding transcriptional regulator YiaG
MTKNEFARLLGVSATSIVNWEKKPGTLDLQARTLAAWKAVKKLTKKQAWRKLRAS